MKNKIFTILIAILLIQPVMAEQDKLQPLELIENMDSERVEEVVEEEIPSIEAIQYKQPVSKRKIAKKFLLAMGGVGISSLLLFILLSLYNKVRSKVIQFNEATTIDAESSLVTPDDYTGAVRTFIEKTKWTN